MKRLYRRLLIVGVVLVLGVIAIAQAQMMGKKDVEPAAQGDPLDPDPSGDKSPPVPIRPIGLSDDSQPLVAPSTSLAMPRYGNELRSGAEPADDDGPAGDPNSYPAQPPYGVQDTYGATYTSDTAGTNYQMDDEPREDATYAIPDKYAAPAYPAYTETPEPSPYAPRGLDDSGQPGGYADPNASAQYASSLSGGYAIGDDEPAAGPTPAQRETSPSEPQMLAADDEAYQPLRGEPVALNDDREADTAEQEYDTTGPETAKPSAVNAVTAGALAGAGAIGAGLARSDTNVQEPTANEASAPATAAPDYSAMTQEAQDGLLDLEPATSDTPGGRQLDGAQTPSLTVEKRAPREIQVGKPAVFETIVRNVGQIDAANVMVVDQIPRGVEYLESTPQPTQAPDGSLLWQLGTLAPGEAKKISVQLMPREEGEIGSVAQVLFAAQAGVRTICTKPELVVEHSAPQRVLIGERVDFSIQVSNPGTGAATGVIIQEDVPEGLTHPAGRELEYEIGDLRPQETKRLELTLVAEQPGVVRNVIVVRGEGGLEARHEVSLEVIAPRLEVAMAGPARRYLERQAQYSVSVSNSGTAPAKNIELVAHLPKGMKFITTDREGQYDPRTHAVYWSLEELPAGETGVVQLTALPVEAGEQELRVDSKADLNLQHSVAKSVQVDALAELSFTVSDVTGPIEVGSETTYVIRVTNNGSKPDTNVQIAAEFPAGMKPLSADGPTNGAVEGNAVAFEPLGRLSVKEEAVYKITAQGTAPGDQLIRVQIQSDELQTPVTKEQQTRVYQDDE